MKLKSLMKVSSVTRTRFTLYHGDVANGQVVLSFLIDYCNQDLHTLNSMIERRTYLEEMGYEVALIRTTRDGTLHVDLKDGAL